MLQHIFGRQEKKKEKEEFRRIQLLRDLSALRNTCKQNIDDAHKNCKEEVHRGDPLMTRMVAANVNLIKSNASLLQKCDATLLGLQNGELRRKGGVVDRLNRLEFKAAYQDAKKGARKTNTNKLRKRAQKMEKYRSICNSNRSLITDCLQDDFEDMFEEDDDSDDDEDVAKFVECIKEEQIIDKVLAAPNPNLSILETEIENDLAGEIRDDV